MQSLALFLSMAALSAAPESSPPIGMYTFPSACATAISAVFDERKWGANAEEIKEFHEAGGTDRPEVWCRISEDHITIHFQNELNGLTRPRDNFLRIDRTTLEIRTNWCREDEPCLD